MSNISLGTLGARCPSCGSTELKKTGDLENSDTLITCLSCDMTMTVEQARVALLGDEVTRAQALDQAADILKKRLFKR